jgi:hypothetical protein
MQPRTGASPVEVQEKMEEEDRGGTHEGNAGKNKEHRKEKESHQDPDLGAEVRLPTVRFCAAGRGARPSVR